MEAEGPATTVASPAETAAHAADAAIFGTRPATGRPHSTSLSGAGRAVDDGATGRAIGLLIGATVGAALMYYLDPERGASRRARVRDRIVRAATMAPDLVESVSEDVASAGRELVAAARAGHAPWAAPGAVGTWTPTRRLVAGAIGGALSLFAAKRQDSLGAAVALVGSALLAGGLRKAPRRGLAATSEPAPNRAAGEFDDALERPRVFEQL